MKLTNRGNSYQKAKGGTVRSFQQTRKQFLRTLGLAAVSGLAMPAGLSFARPLVQNNKDFINSK